MVASLSERNAAAIRLNRALQRFELEASDGLAVVDWRLSGSI
jgi:hypothetical protein